MENLIDQETLTVRLVRRWITNNTLPIKSRIQEIWTATANPPAKCRAPRQSIRPLRTPVRVLQHIELASWPADV